MVHLVQGEARKCARTMAGRAARRLLLQGSVRDPALRGHDGAADDEGGAEGLPAVGRRMRSNHYADQRSEEQRADDGAAMDATWSQGVQRKADASHGDLPLVAHDVPKNT